MTAATPYPTLDAFFGGYMHQDWRDDYADEWAAVDAFVAEGPAEAPGLFRSEIAMLLTQHPTEDEVRRVVLDDLDSYYLADVSGWKYRDWLQALSDHAAKATGHPRAS
jgi:hypothetical protein